MHQTILRKKHVVILHALKSHCPATGSVATPGCAPSSIASLLPFSTAQKRLRGRDNLGYPAARSRGAPEGAISRISSSGSAWNFVVPFIGPNANLRNNVKELETVYFRKILGFSQLVGFSHSQILEFLRPAIWPIHHHSLHMVLPSQSERHWQL